MPESYVPGILSGALKFGIKPGLERISRLMELLGNPQEEFKSVHIAGTNGKGSVSSFLSTILACSGRKVGIFTSPYLERFTERIRVIDGREDAIKLISDDSTGEITPQDLERLADKVKKAQEIMLSEGLDDLTEFELITAFCFLYFAEQKVDVAVLETGLGGRLDSTNIVKTPVATGICAIGLDHCGVLGNTVAEITAEKAGIFKPSCPAICLDPDDMILDEDMKPDVRKVLIARAEETGSPISFVSVAKAVKTAKFTPEGRMTFEYNGKTYNTGLNGRHQVSNAALAIELAKACGVSDEAISDGISLAVWKSRAEIMSLKPVIVIDGGHNPQGAQSLAMTLNDILEGSLNGKELRVVIGMMADKDIDGVLSSYRDGGLKIKEAFCVRPDNPRSLEPSELSRQINLVYNSMVQTRTFERPEEGVAEAFKASLADNVPLLVTGSLYLTGQIRSYLKGLINCTTI